ncbi:MAG TPA: PrsW family intramembrane metalloprotease [Actinoplanes sp.]|nr:PrsW family intramembrane metalloprotease [Actinoplanes sp.]
MADVAAGGAPDPALPTVPPAASPTSHASPQRRSAWPRVLMLTGVIGFVAACAVGMLLFLGFNLGITGLLVGLAASILPVPVFVGCFLWLDRYQPAPIRYLVICFGWGAFVSTGASLLVNTGAAALFEKIGLPEALVAVLVAPFIEEATKALGPLLLLLLRPRRWSGMTDGIVYCGLSAVGFAMVENILYLGGHGYAAGAEQYGPASGAQALLATFILRILLTGFAHPMFTALAGIGLGMASRSADRRVIWCAPIAGLLLAMILHGTWNLLPTLAVALEETLILLYGYLALMIPIFFGMVGLALGLRSWEGRLSERILPRYVAAGWLSPPELAALGSLGRRHGARRWARRVAGDPGLKAMQGFQDAATQLALVRDGLQRGLYKRPHEIERAIGDERRLLDTIGRYRAVFVGRDPQMPQAFWTGSRYRITFPDGVSREIDAPTEPMVPVPVRLAAPAMASVGYPQPMYAPPGYAPAAYAAPAYPPAMYASPRYAPAGYAPATYAPPAFVPPMYAPPAGAHSTSGPGPRPADPRDGGGPEAP